jgi:hydrogenase maturation protein HypF
MNQLIAQRWQLTGQVQGVGFRPYVYRLAKEYALNGWVKNRIGQVEIHLQGTPEALAQFAANFHLKAPPLVQAEILSVQTCACEAVSDFQIISSTADADSFIHLPPDYFTCSECLQELSDPQNRRYRYPFINCTQCGARYTLITRLPYDRPNTSMRDFPLCTACATEYHDPNDRRFHAQPVACPECGPVLSFEENAQSSTQGDAVLSAAITALKAGKIIAIKGVGGYHLMCDARNVDSIARLRAQKPRPAKPLTVMFPRGETDELGYVKQQVTLNESEAQLLSSAQSPILLLSKAASYDLPELIAPNLNEIGVILPYSPLHHLLLQEFASPLIATSANLSGEPVLTENHEVTQRLNHLADAYLHHNRPIVRPADDAVFRSIQQSPRPLRLGRGCAPLEIRLPFKLPHPVLAVGGHLKNTIALATEDRIMLSPHIGDLSSARSMDVFSQVIQDFQQIYKIQAQMLIYDAHPNYASTRWAKRCALPAYPVLHHHAHASAVAGEFQNSKPWLIFTWDGVGFGENSTLWGGEALYGHPGQWQRLAHLKAFRLLGGEQVTREVWRTALSLAWEAGVDFHCVENVEKIAVFRKIWDSQLNCPQTTAAGRLFDGLASLLGIIHTASFEGQAPMYLEAIAASFQGLPRFPKLALQSTATGWQVDWSPLVEYMQDATYSQAERAAGAHHSLADALLQQTLAIRAAYPVAQVGLAGGVFQNRLLSELVINLLENNGINVYFPKKLPVNDAAISAGQVFEYLYKTQSVKT